MHCDGDRSHGTNLQHDSGDKLVLYRPNEELTALIELRSSPLILS